MIFSRCFFLFLVMMLSVGVTNEVSAAVLVPLPKGASTPVTAENVGSDKAGVHIFVKDEKLQDVLQAIQNQGGPRFELDTLLRDILMNRRVTAKNWTEAVKLFLGKRFNLLVFYDDKNRMERVVIMTTQNAPPIKGGAFVPADNTKQTISTVPLAGVSEPPPASNTELLGSALAPPGVDPYRAVGNDGPPLDKVGFDEGPPVDQVSPENDGPPVVGQVSLENNGPPLGQPEDGGGPPMHR